MRNTIITLFLSIVALFGGSQLIGARVPDNNQVIFDIPMVLTVTSSPLAAGKANQDMLCEPPIVDIATAQGSIASSFKVGTTTLGAGSGYVNTTTASLIAATVVPTSTTGYFVPRAGFNILGGSGSYYTANTTTTVPWFFRANEYILLTSNFQGATSTSSTLPVGGFTLVGSLKLKCIKK